VQEEDAICSTVLAARGIGSAPGDGDPLRFGGSMETICERREERRASLLREA
jgi:hypothetical protein